MQEIIRPDAKVILEIKTENGSKNRISRKLWHQSCYNTKLHKCNQS